MDVVERDACLHDRAGSCCCEVHAGDEGVVCVEIDELNEVGWDVRMVHEFAYLDGDFEALVFFDFFRRGDHW